MWVTDECKNSFMEMKWKKVHRYIVFKIDERSRLVTVDKVGGPGESYADLAASLPGDDCRYAVFDFDFVTVDNCRKSKIFFIAWYDYDINLSNPQGACVIACESVNDSDTSNVVEKNGLGK